MIFTLLDQLGSQPVNALVTLGTFCLALLVALVSHEFSHALVATVSGDPTPRRQGRLSLDPMAHLDPLGTMMVLVAGFGWAKPVEVNAALLRTGARTGMAAVALAGPLSNVVIASVLALPIKAGLVNSAFVGFGLFRGGPEQFLGYLLGSLVFWNLLIASFNLIPLAPLDGSKVLLGILPPSMAATFAKLERYGPLVLMGVIIFDVLSPGPRILPSVIGPIINALGFLVLGRQLL